MSHLVNVVQVVVLMMSAIESVSHSLPPMQHAIDGTASGAPTEKPPLRPSSERRAHRTGTSSKRLATDTYSVSAELNAPLRFSGADHSVDPLPEQVGVAVVSGIVVY
jgi:hypothetical protein